MDEALKARQPTKELRLKRKILGRDGGRVEQVKWGKDNQLLTLTSGASSLTSLLVWDAPSGIRTHLVIPMYSWLLASAIEQKEGQFVACGGLENICCVYKLESGSESIETASAELKQHDGYISDIKFVHGKERILTSSGDSECILWDVEKQMSTSVHSGHDADVTGIALNPAEPDVFISGGVDNTVKAWDMRVGKTVATYDCGDEVNHVSYFPDGNAFCAALGNSECKIFDDRAGGLYKTFTSPNGSNSECKMAQFSNSGRLLFACYDDESCFAFDVAVDDGPAQRLDSDKVRAKCLDVHPQGYALAIGDGGSGKDTSVKIFWP